MSSEGEELSVDQPAAAFSGQELAHDLTNEPEAQEQPVDAEHGNGRIEAELVRDFYLSFKFSQGDQRLQDLYLNAIAADYFSRGLSPTSELTSEFVHKVRNLNVPGRHTGPMGDDLAQKNFLWMASRTLGYLSDAERGKNKSDQPIELVYMATYMLAVDTKYMVGGRPGAGGKRGESQWQPYVLDGQPSGSAFFNALFARVKDLAERVRLGQTSELVEQGVPELECQDLAATYEGWLNAWNKTHAEE